MLAKKYIFTWFVIDIISILPLDIIMSPSTTNGSNS